jgi:hypothetical protein
MFLYLIKTTLNDIKSSLFFFITIFFILIIPILIISKIGLRHSFESVISVSYDKINTETVYFDEYNSFFVETVYETIRDLQKDIKTSKNFKKNVHNDHLYNFLKNGSQTSEEGSLIEDKIKKSVLKNYNYIIDMDQDTFLRISVIANNYKDSDQELVLSSLEQITQKFVLNIKDKLNKKLKKLNSDKIIYEDLLDELNKKSFLANKNFQILKDSYLEEYFQIFKKFRVSKRLYEKKSIDQIRDALIINNKKNVNRTLSVNVFIAIILALIIAILATSIKNNFNRKKLKSI